MEPTQKQWDDAEKDGAILEAKIAQLVEEFEQKHKPIQVSIVTRFRHFDSKYSLSKGGAAQIKLLKTLPEDGDAEIQIIRRSRLLKPIDEIEYTEP